MGMEQVSDPPGDLTWDTPAKGKGGKETSEKSRQVMLGSQEKKIPNQGLPPGVDLHLYWALGEYG